MDMLKEELADKLVIGAEAYLPSLRALTKSRLILAREDFRKRTHQKPSHPLHGNGGCYSNHRSSVCTLIFSSSCNGNKRAAGIF